MKVLAPSYLNSFKCKCKTCRNSCCKNWRIDVHSDDIQKYKDLNDSSIFSFIVIDKPETNDGFVQKDTNKCCPFIDTDGLCKIQKKYGEALLPKVCRHYPKNIYKNGGYNHLAMSNGCEKTIELLFELNKYTLESTEYDFGTDSVKIIDPILEEKQKQIIDLLNDDQLKLSDILINHFCSNIETSNRDTNFDISHCFNFWLHMTHKLGEHKASLASYHNDMVTKFKSNTSPLLDQYLDMKKQFDHNHVNNDKFLKNLLCNYIFYSNAFALPLSNQSVYYEKICFIYIILKFVTTVVFYNTSETDKYVDCITHFCRTFQNSTKIQLFMSILKASGMNEQEFLKKIIKVL